MNRRRRISLLTQGLLLFGCAFASPSSAATPAEDLARIATAADAHPDDPDLAWATAQAAAHAGDPSAPDRVAQFAARWPGRRAGIALALGKALASVGRDAEALRSFDQAVQEAPDDGAAWLHRGLALRRLGRLGEADAALARAAETTPALAPEALLLRGLGKRAEGDDAEADSFLRATIDVDPDGEAARRARLVLGEVSPGVATPAFSLFAQGGFEWDSNVTLDGKLQFAGGDGARNDISSVFASGVVLRPVRGERIGLSLGYRYDGSLHDDLPDYDLGNHLAFAALVVRLTQAVSLRVDGLFDHARLGDARYAQTRSVRPNLFFALGERIGVLRAYGDVEQRSYFDEPALSSLDRDGRTWGVGLEHAIPLPIWRGVLLTLGARYANNDTFADPDFLGFDDAYDHLRWEGLLRLEAPLFWKISATSTVLVGRERYAAPNVIDFLTDDGVGNASARERRDWVTDAAIALVRPVYGSIAIEVGWRGTFRSSNVDLYAYDRHVLGVTMRVVTP